MDDKSKGRTENGNKKYTINSKKLSRSIAVLCLIAAAVIIAFYYIDTNKGAEVAAAVIPQPENSESKPPSLILFEKIIVIDAGHGGEDPGTIGVRGSVESELNLKVSIYLKAQFESNGAKVVMTRNGDKLADTKEEDWEKRNGIISGSGADIVVSIHMNSYSDPSVSGPLVIFLIGSEQGRILADCIQRSMNEHLKPASSGNSRAEDLLILKYGNQPSVLVECGYISNPKEEEKLITQDYQQKTAAAICDGVIAYFDE